MMAEIGLFAFILAFIFSVLLTIVPGLGCFLQKPTWQETAKTFVVGQFVFVAAAYVCLTVCFLQDDFSVRYVLMNSSVSLPWFYKLCAVWGGHEGSMLLWVLILSAWMLAAALLRGGLSLAMQSRVLVVLGAVSIGFLSFVLLASNPFLRQFEVLNGPGRDLNPLLQDPGFLFHPPMLYMGYVGFSVAFAFAIAALWLGRVESAWSKWARPWTLAAWCCLTIGITLGSWWAYRELGWGGWWFWDPVENASFMPWLSGTALIHSLMVSEQRQQFQAWTLLLAITTFSLSLIGTFLVRSGVLTSVHAFAVDPTRGLFILIFLSIVIGSSLLLFSIRAPSVQATGRFRLFSRESTLLLNNVFLSVCMLTVLLGTVYPLLIDGLGLGKLSVGAPYFNTVFIPLFLPLLVLMGVGVQLHWQSHNMKSLWPKLRWMLILSLVFPMLTWVFDKPFNLSVWLGLGVAAWVILGTLSALITKWKQRSIKQISPAFWGMMMAHTGIAITVIGIAVSSGYGEQTDVKMAPGTAANLAGYMMTFVGESPLKGPNYHGTRVKVLVTRGHDSVAIYPEKRIYDVGQMVMTDSAIDVTPFRDLYVALGEPIDETAWSVRLYYKPFVRWIWGGGFLILFGGLSAFFGAIRRVSK